MLGFYSQIFNEAPRGCDTYRLACTGTGFLCSMVPEVLSESNAVMQYLCSPYTAEQQYCVQSHVFSSVVQEAGDLFPLICYTALPEILTPVRQMCETSGHQYLASGFLYLAHMVYWPTPQALTDSAIGFLGTRFL
jgi:hypothetical protein